jgi:hypothetical protein
MNETSSGVSGEWRHRQSMPISHSDLLVKVLMHKARSAYTVDESDGQPDSPKLRA